ncbi:MAG: sugar phosphate isomerase/epimerase [Pirellulaceae bacterium]|nr:sugar phosphate isomerase/epimerase [Pirellulaceae bacterium]
MTQPTNQFDRRRFLVAAAASTVTAPLIAPGRISAQAPDESVHKICVFTKPFNSLSFDELADRIAELGFDGIEAPIRKGGHIETEAIADELPELVDALKKRDLEITLVTSDINDPNDPLTTKFLRTLGTLGIKRYRLKYLHYDFAIPVNDQLANWKTQLRDLAALNHDYGVQGLYQNHAGAKNMGAALWDLRQVLDGISTDDLAVAYDIRHAVAEAANCWPVNFQMIRPHIGMVYVKDFQWIDQKVQNVPLGEGRVEERFFEMLRDSGFDGPISLHEEYLDHKNPQLVPDHLSAIKKDLATLRSWLKS